MTINSESSCQSSLQQPKNTIKASDWVSVLQRQSTPVKGKEIQGMDHEDSAKKKKKFARYYRSYKLDALRLNTSQSF